MQINRLPAGGRIDRAHPLGFSFDGRDFEGYAGDTLASALIANDVSVVGRSFKYHRPRGIICSGSDEPNAILQIGAGATADPARRATEVELYDGLRACAGKGWPSVNFDVAAINDWLSRVFGAGFYYKTFMYPAKLWPLYESLIRKSAGLGKAPTKADPDIYDHCNAHCDVLVVGAGPAGLMAALAAGRSGARVIIADEQNEFGGSLLASRDFIDGRPASAWALAQYDELKTCRNVTCLPRSTVFGYYDHNFLGIVERRTNHLGEHVPGRVRQRLWRVRAKQVILAQGAFERPIVFCNNDRPGIMLASALSTYVNRYAVRPGKRAVVFTNNDSAYQAALDLHHAGAEVVAIVDSRPTGAAGIADRVTAAGIEVRHRSVVTDIRGRRRVRGVHTSRLEGFDREVLDCDLVAMSGGWSPAVHLHSQAGGKITWDEGRHCFVPGEVTQANLSVGSCNGTWDLASCLREGIAAGCAAAKRCGRRAEAIGLPATDHLPTNGTAALWRVPDKRDPERRPKQFVDYQNDVTVSDIRLAAREGYKNVEHVKRYTALGFGTDQGKLGNINGMALIAECLGKPVSEIGTTTFRPAYTPVGFGVCGGENTGPLYDPVRKTALHELHRQLGARFELVGQWLRPWYYPRGDENLHAAVRRECLATRGSVGIMDASTLGKIEVRGPDSVTFLERMYTHNISGMRIRQCTYGIILGEDGMVMDDGVVARLGDKHFYLTTTTGGAARVLGWLERWLQTEWPEFEVYLTSVTDHYSTIAVVGPRSRALLNKVGCSIDIAKSSFPFMAVRWGTLGGLPVKLFRVSFSGELAFEVNVDSNYAAQLWLALMEAGEEFDITPYGTETMHVLRAEKGFVIVGQDTDGSVTPVDLRMNWLLSKDKDFLGKRSLARSDCRRSDRKQFVGLISEDGVTVVPEGAQLVTGQTAEPPTPTSGHVTSSYYSAVLGHPIGLGLIRSGHSRFGEVVRAVTSDGRQIPVQIVSPVFYDAKGERQNV